MDTCKCGGGLEESLGDTDTSPPVAPAGPLGPGRMEPTNSLSSRKCLASFHFGKVPSPSHLSFTLINFNLQFVSTDNFFHLLSVLIVLLTLLSSTVGAVSFFPVRVIHRQLVSFTSPHLRFVHQLDQRHLALFYSFQRRVLFSSRDLRRVHRHVSYLHLSPHRVYSRFFKPCHNGNPFRTNSKRYPLTPATSQGPDLDQTTFRRER